MCEHPRHHGPKVCPPPGDHLHVCPRCGNKTAIYVPPDKK